MVGLGLEGQARVSEGDLAEGMRRLDEATAAALAGEAKILVCVAWACCADPALSGSGDGKRLREHLPVRRARRLVALAPARGQARHDPAPVVRTHAACDEPVCLESGDHA
jgi:hypothetical protein